MKRATLGDRLRYAFDNLLSRGTVAMIGWLALLTIAITFVVSLVVWMAEIAGETSFLEQFWSYLMLTLDADAMGGTPWSFRLAGLTITFTGVFVTSVLVGLLATGIGSRIDELRKGRSRVVEAGHTVILGWSPQVFPILSELVVANANRPGSCIVVLGDKDKVDMEDEIRDRVGSTGRTRIVCRRGSPMEMSDLGIVSLNTARSIIVLAPDGPDPDSSVIKTMLAITNNPERRHGSCHVVAEIRDARNVEVARIATQGEVELVQTGELVARIVAQTCLHSGLSVVYTELLDFAGDEIYFQDEPALVGKSFGEALVSYEDSAVMGLCSGQGGVKLNPPMTRRIEEGDRIIAISEDDDTVRLSGLAELGIDESAIRTPGARPPAPRHVLVLGWNRRGRSIVGELDQYLAPGSKVTVLADMTGDGSQIVNQCAGAANLTITCRQGDTTDREWLDSLPLGGIDHVIVLSYSDDLDVQQADARTLVTLLLLRDISRRGGYSFSIVSEMRDMRNRNLAEVARADDFIVSDKLVSLTLSQIAENKALGAVFADLFDPEGSEIYLKPAEDYVVPGRPLNFYTVVDAARRRQEVALGYRRHTQANDATKAYGVVINPEKSSPITFEEGDRVIVLAER